MFDCNRPRPTGSVLDIVTIAVMVFVFIEIPTPNTKRRETVGLQCPLRYFRRRKQCNADVEFSNHQSQCMRVKLFNYSMTLKDQWSCLSFQTFGFRNGLRREGRKSHCSSAGTSRDTRFTKPRATY